MPTTLRLIAQRRIAFLVLALLSHTVARLIGLMVVNSYGQVGMALPGSSVFEQALIVVMDFCIPFMQLQARWPDYAFPQVVLALDALALGCVVLFVLGLVLESSRKDRRSA